MGMSARVTLLSIVPPLIAPYPAKMLTPRLLAAPITGKFNLAP
jgi:hypothetical protein